MKASEERNTQPWFKCLRPGHIFSDTRGQALTEYVLLSSMALILGFYLFHPDNIIFYGIRNLYDRTITLTLFLGP